MSVEQARVVSHEALESPGYRVIRLAAPEMAAAAEPGQFIHVQVPRLENAVLRRPFSIYGARDGVLSILYKQIGKGTRALTDVRVGEDVSVIGPLGRGFPSPQAETTAVLVAGGYGVAPLSFVARRMGRRGRVFIGGANADAILCADDFLEMGWDVRIATEDGSRGARGRVTDLLDRWVADEGGAGLNPELFACGPDGMLKALGLRAIQHGWKAWLSLDKHMGCGVGACLACVHRIRLDDGEETWGRVCTDGPVFESRQIVWKEPAP
jgi:dihydroorotate dehydrogenase electron transfer subunit